MSQSVHRIEQVLLQCGVTGITKEYGPDAKLAAIMFSVLFDQQTRLTIRLPAKEQAAWDALWRDYAGDDLSADHNSLIYSSRKTKRKSDFKEQSERTAWKLVSDWVEIQMSFIQLGQAEIREVFMSYIWDGEKTLFQRFSERGWKALLPETTESNKEAA